MTAVTGIKPALGLAPGDSVQTNFIDIPGVRLAYDLSGHGDAVVFLHGGLLDRRQWDQQFKLFTETHLTIRYDLRSAGESVTTPTTEPFTHHEDLFHVLDALGVKRISLVGHSNYAIALDFTLAYPDMVEKLVLVSPGLRGYELRDPWVKIKFTEMMGCLGQRDLSGAVETFLRMWVDGPNRQPDHVDPHVRTRVREMATRAFSLSRLAPNAKGLEPPAIGRFSEVRVPTLVVLGNEDAADIHAIGKLIHDGIASSQLQWVNNAGHSLNMEKPDDFNSVVSDFLRQCDLRLTGGDSAQER